MFHSNVPAQFETELHSQYRVDRYGLIRDKVADPNHKTEREEKNIYYIDEKDGDKILVSTSSKAATGQTQWDLNRVVSIMEDTHQLVLRMQGSSKEMIIDMYRAPKEGLSPFDFVCEANGTIPKNNSNHVGHKIIKITRTDFDDWKAEARK